MLLVTEYFYPDTTASTAGVLTELALELSARGFAIDVLCGQPSYNGYRHAAWQEQWHGIHISRVAELRVNRNSGAGRLISWFWFLAQCAPRMFWPRTSYAAILIVTNPAPAVALGAVFRRRHKGRFVAIVHDVFPENAVAVGKLRPGSLPVRAMQRINRTSFRSADAIVTLGQDMKSVLCGTYGLPRDKVVVVPNWVSEQEADLVASQGDLSYWQKTLGLGARFLVLYAGNFGLAQDADLVIACLNACRAMTDVVFCFAGAGGQYDQLRVHAESGAIPNLRVVPFQTGARYAALLRLAGCGLVSLHPGYSGLGLPSKVRTYMAVGLPVIALTEANSDLGRMVAENAFGSVCESPQTFAATVRMMVEDGELRKRFSDAAHLAATGPYAKTRCIDTYATILGGEEAVPAT